VRRCAPLHLSIENSAGLLEVLGEPRHMEDVFAFGQSEIFLFIRAAFLL
jgi:hypothetical protein